MAHDMQGGCRRSRNPGSLNDTLTFGRRLRCIRLDLIYKIQKILVVGRRSSCDSEHFTHCANRELQNGIRTHFSLFTHIIKRIFVRKSCLKP